MNCLPSYTFHPEPCGARRAARMRVGPYGKQDNRKRGRTDLSQSLALQACVCGSGGCVPLSLPRSCPIRELQPPNRPGRWLTPSPNAFGRPPSTVPNLDWEKTSTSARTHGGVVGVGVGVVTTTAAMPCGKRADGHWDRPHNQRSTILCPTTLISSTKSPHDSRRTWKCGLLEERSGDGTIAVSE